jgi:hypothetical protein
MSGGWVVFRVATPGRVLNLVGTSNARTRDTAIKDCAAGGGEYVAIPARYLEKAIVHDQTRYIITARGGTVS